MNDVSDVHSILENIGYIVYRSESQKNISSMIADDL